MKQATQVNIRLLQITGWSVFYIISVLYLLPNYGLVRSLLVTLVGISFYLMLIYGNALVLIPQFFERKKFTLYFLILFLFFISMALFRVFVNHALLFNVYQELYYDYHVGHFIYTCFSSFLILIVSVLFKMAINYFDLLKRQETLKAQRYQAELNLLKSKVQPHFLFNTLNNIYYHIYKEAPQSSSLISKLSELMRYFIDESIKERVSLATEITFLENYINLEKIRMRHGLDISINILSSKDISLPPMLLMPFIENVFKHGVDKRSVHNNIKVSLYDEGKFLFFKVENPLYANDSQKQTGQGLANLRDRLNILFPDNFHLMAKPVGGSFVAELRIPMT